MKLDDRARLGHMLESAEDAISFLGCMTADELAQNRMALQAIVRSVEAPDAEKAGIKKTIRW